MYKSCKMIQLFIKMNNVRNMTLRVINIRSNEFGQNSINSFYQETIYDCLS